MIIDGFKVSQVVCLNCKNRWVAARLPEIFLDQLECPKCGKDGFAIESGETNLPGSVIKMAVAAPCAFVDYTDQSGKTVLPEWMIRID